MAPPIHSRRAQEPARRREIPGELIYVSTAPRPARPGELTQGEVRLALVMARSDEHLPDRFSGSVRLVQDFGRPSDPPGAHPMTAPGLNGAPAPIRRGRGRPPGSKNKKPLNGTPAPNP